MAEKEIGDEDMRVLASRIRATTYECDGTCRLHCDELKFNGNGEIFLKVVGNGVESIVWHEDGKIYANDELPPIEGVEIVPFTETDRYKNRRFILNM